MVEGMGDLYAVAGIGGVAFIGSAVFMEVGKPNIAKGLDLVAFLAVAGIAFKLLIEVFKVAEGLIQ